MASQEDQMQLISKVAEQTGISVNTLRHWVRTEQLSEFEKREVPGGYAYYTTVRAANQRKANKTYAGKPIRSRS